MTEKDRELVAEARLIPYTDWGRVLLLRDRADTEEARAVLDRIAFCLSHEEEAALEQDD